MLWRLGLDVGTNSIGWTILTLKGKAKTPAGVAAMGVRIFPDGREKAAKDRVGDSLAVARRMARGMRRNRDRRQDRLRDCAKALTGMGLLPKDSNERRDLFRQIDPYEARSLAVTKKVDEKTLARAIMHFCKRRGFLSNRKADSGGDADDENRTGQMKAFEEYLTKRKITLGQYLFERLNYRIVDENGSEFDQRVRFDEDAVKEMIDGEERAIYPKRQMYIDEFRAMRAKQGTCHLSDKNWDKLFDILFFQRRLLPQEIGLCTFEHGSGKKRASKHLPISHRFRIVQEVNNLTFTDKGKTRSLTQAERNRLLTELEMSKTLSFSSMKKKKLLDLPATGYFNLEGTIGNKKRDKLKGNEIACDMRNLFEEHGQDWDVLDEEMQNDCVQALLDAESTQDFRKTAKNNKWHFPDELVDALLEHTLQLSASYGKLSRVAMQKLLGPMTADDEATGEAMGKLYWEAAHLVYGGHTDRDFDSGDLFERLTYYGEVLPDALTPVRKKGVVAAEEKEYGRIPNPTVHVALNQLRRVVNELIDRYGKPAEIHIELARDIKNNAQKRLEITAEINKNTKENERRRKEIAAIRKIKEENVTGEEIAKYKLWEELAKSDRSGDAGNMARIDIYTGKPISLRKCLSDEVEIEHILPFKMTYDNSMANKTVTFREVNRKKRKRTPYQYAIEIGKNTVEEIVERAANLPLNKRWRFQEDAMEVYEKKITNRLTPIERDKYDMDLSGAFLDRQLVDTQYIAKVAARYLASIVGRDNVVPVNGQMTALLRRKWKLEEAKGKGTEQERADHRHHAVDALVVAMTNRAMIRAITDYTQEKQEKRGENDAKLYAPELEAAIRDQMHACYDEIQVSFKPDHRLNGKFFQETAYGFLKEDAIEREDGYNAVMRRKISGLKESEIEQIRDVPLRNAIQKTLGTAKFTKLNKWEEKMALLRQEGVLVKGRRQRLRSVRILIKNQTIVPIPSAPYKGYPPDATAFCDIWKVPDQNSKGKYTGKFNYEGTFITYAEAKRFEDLEHPDRVRDAELFEELRRQHRIHPAAKRLMRLFKDDMVQVEDDKGEKHLMRVAGYSTTDNRLDLRPHTQTEGKQVFKSINGLMSSEKSPGKLTKMKKVLITPAGQLIL